MNADEHGLKAGGSASLRRARSKPSLGTPVSSSEVTTGEICQSGETPPKTFLLILLIRVISAIRVPFRLSGLEFTWIDTNDYFLLLSKTFRFISGFGPKFNKRPTSISVAFK